MAWLDLSSGYSQKALRLLIVFKGFYDFLHIVRVKALITADRHNMEISLSAPPYAKINLGHPEKAFLIAPYALCLCLWAVPT